MMTQAPPALPARPRRRPRAEDSPKLRYRNFRIRLGHFLQGESVETIATVEDLDPRTVRRILKAGPPSSLRGVI